MAAQTRMAYDDDKQTWNANGLRVTDYKGNSRVIFPKALPLADEQKLEVLRLELLHQYRSWVRDNCNHQGDQKMNLTGEEQRGLKSLRRRMKEGELVILPTDKSGRFAVMTMETYLRAGQVHTKGDRVIGWES